MINCFDSFLHLDDLFETQQKDLYVFVISYAFIYQVNI